MTVDFSLEIMLDRAWENSQTTRGKEEPIKSESHLLSELSNIVMTE